VRFVFKDEVETFHRPREGVDDYIDTCAKIGKSPQKPYSGNLMLRVDPAVHSKMALAAEVAGKSLNQWGEEVLREAAEKQIT
jgi:predicted HicB family RNase H-like nuclease